MTEGDFAELVILAGLFGLAFTVSIRFQLFIALSAMAINMVLGRIFIIHFEQAWALCSVMQTILATLLVWTAQTRLSIVLGGLYAGMVTGGGATSLGYLAPETSNGLTWNYWSGMSILTYAQFVTVFFVWAYVWTRARINRMA